MIIGYNILYEMDREGIKCKIVTVLSVGQSPGEEEDSTLVSEFTASYLSAAEILLFSPLKPTGQRHNCSN